MREAAVISLLANAGLRPGEALALRWDCVGDRVLIVEHGLDGSLKSTKTDRIRTVSLLAAVIEELDAWRTVEPIRDDDLLFPQPDGQVFRDTDYHNWRARQFDPLARAAEIGGARRMPCATASRALVQAGRRA